MSDPPPSTTTFSARAREFLELPHFAVVASVNPDGSPHQAVVWYFLDEGEIVFNSAEGRRWPTNLERNPRASVAVEDAYTYVSMSGTVTIETDQVRAQADIERLTRRYHSDPSTVARQVAMFRRQQRVSFRLRPVWLYERFGE